MLRPRLRIEHDGMLYRFERMSAWEAHWVNGLIAPIVAKFGANRAPVASAGQSPKRAVQPDAWIEKLINMAGELTEAEVERLLSVTVGVAERQDAHDVSDVSKEPPWRQVWDCESGKALVQGFDGIEVLRLAAAIVASNLRRFWDYEPAQFDRSGKAPDYKPVHLPRNLDFLLLPVRRQMLAYDKLLDGTVDLADVALMNDALAVDAENMARAQAATKA